MSHLGRVLMASSWPGPISTYERKHSKYSNAKNGRIIKPFAVETMNILSEEEKAWIYLVGQTVWLLSKFKRNQGSLLFILISYFIV